MEQREDRFSLIAIDEACSLSMAQARRSIAVARRYERLPIPQPNMCAAPATPAKAKTGPRPSKVRSRARAAEMHRICAENGVPVHHLSAFQRKRLGVRVVD